MLPAPAAGGNRPEPARFADAASDVSVTERRRALGSAATVGPVPDPPSAAGGIRYSRATLLRVAYPPPMEPALAADVPAPRRAPSGALPLLRERLGVRAAAWIARERGRRRWVLDLVFAVVLPPLLFVLDRHTGLTAAAAEHGVAPFRPYTPLLTAACVAVYVTWMATRRRPGRGHAVLAGPLAMGAALALAVGLLLLPFSVIGIAFGGVGFLGFVPFVTAYAYLRAAILAADAARRAPPAAPRLVLGGLATLLLCIAVVGTGRLARQVERTQTRVVAGEVPGDRVRAERILTVLWYVPQVPLHGLRRKALGEGYGPRRGRGEAAAAYERITGHPVREDS